MLRKLYEDGFIFNAYRKIYIYMYIYVYVYAYIYIYMTAPSRPGPLLLTWLNLNPSMDK